MTIKTSNFSLVDKNVFQNSGGNSSYSLNLNEFESNPYRFNNELNDACVPFDL